MNLGLNQQTPTVFAFKALTNPATLLWLLVIVLSACVPVIRTEYLSPSWRGILVDGTTGKPIVGVAVTDLYTEEKVKTDKNGYFELAPATTEFSFKLPVASMAGIYQIEVSLPSNSIRFSGRRLAVNTEPSEFNLGTFPISAAAYTSPFLLKDKDELLPLPRHLIEDCGVPLQDAINLASSARLYKQLLDKQHNLGHLKVTLKDVELAYLWASNGWEFAGDNCFRQDYAQSLALYPYITLFFDEAQTYSLKKGIER